MARGPVSLLARPAVLSGSPRAPRPRLSAQPVDGKSAFERLKTLAGTWEGKAGHGDAGQAATVTYRLASGGSVVEETLFPGTPHEMISMYHLVDGQLVMTHYCAMANQPRMRLDAKASTPDRLVFAFDGGHELRPRQGHPRPLGRPRVEGREPPRGLGRVSGGKETGQNRFVLHRKK